MTPNPTWIVFSKIACTEPAAAVYGLRAGPYAGRKPEPRRKSGQFSVFSS